MQDDIVKHLVSVISDAAVQLDVSPAAATRGLIGVDSGLEIAADISRAVAKLPLNAESLRIESRIKELVAELRSQQLARERSKLAVITAQLAKLRAARTVDDLAAAIPAQTAALGYERVMFSWVQDERWVPASSYTTSGPSESRTLLAAGGPPYYPVRYLHEVDVVRKRSAILVLAANDSPRTHPTIQPVSRAETYVAAPVVAKDRVTAMVHVARNLETGTNDEYDRDLLHLFCQNIGIMIDRLVGSPAAQPTTIDDLGAEWLDALTERELEVLAAMAAGLTNAQIGERLYISEQTTKSHVKNVMRKIGAANRVHASAMYYQAQIRILNRGSTPR